jgi:PKD repeat protein
MLLVATQAVAAGVIVSWNPVSGAAGYMVYYGPAAGNYPSRIDVGNATTSTVSGLAEGATYHFAVTAYDASHVESPFSNDVANTIPYTAPVAQFTASTTSGVAPLALNFLSASTGSITSYSWTFGDGTTSNVANPSKVYSSPGTYTVSLTVTGPGGSNTQTRTNYIIVSTPAPVAQFTGSPTSGTSPLTVAFSSASTGSITSYSWTFGDGTTSTVASPSKVYASPGTYTVSLTVTGPGGSNTQTRTNYIIVSTPAPVAQFTGSPTSGTSPLTVAFSNTSTGSITGYSWTFGDGTTSTAASPSKVYASPGTYTVSLTVTGPGGSNTQTRTNYVTVNTPAPVAQFTGSPTSGTSPLTVAFSNTSTGSITGYSWTFGDGTTSTVASPSKVYASPGTFTVSLTVTGPGGSNTQTRANYVTVLAPHPDLGVYRNSQFLLSFDLGPVADATIPYGITGDLPLAAHVTPTGKSSLIVYRNGIWFVDNNRDGVADTFFSFGGAPADIPLTANLSGPGATDSLVIYRNGHWFVDDDFDGKHDRIFSLGGSAGDIPLVGDVDGDGIDDLVIYRNGVWHVSTKRDGKTDFIFYHGGSPGDIPLLFDWDGDGKADLCIFRNGMWFVSTKRDGLTDVILSYGSTGDRPIVGSFH